ncbi:MAG: metal-dependent hydrolase [Thermodesulfobacteriota bacterium]
MEKLCNGIGIKYFGHSAFEILTVNNKKILVDPWIYSNPSCPEEHKKVNSVDVVAVTHGHFDHIGDLLQIAKEHNPKIVANLEICDWLGTKGIENCMPMNKGGMRVVDGIKFVMTHAQHSSGIKDDDGTMVYGGEPGGYIIELENGYKLYHAGDTNLFGDLKLIGELYKPDLSMLPIGDVFTMSPFEASHACRFLNSKYVVPMHYATFPLLIGTPEDLRELTRDIEHMEIITLQPGDTLR